MPRVVLFDLDGTVSDSAAGILASLRHAFAVNALPPMDLEVERAILGPPFYESLPPLIGEVPLASVITDADPAMTTVSFGDGVAVGVGVGVGVGAGVGVGVGATVAGSGLVDVPAFGDQDASVDVFPHQSFALFSCQTSLPT